MRDECSRYRRKLIQYQDKIPMLFPQLFKNNIDYSDYVIKDTLCRTITFQVTDACNLACTYCYQINKGTRKMSLETAKKFVDMLITGEKGMKGYIDPIISPYIILDFIGGEPFLEIELIDQILDYFLDECIKLNHPWATRFIASFSSNGTLYRDPKVQKFLTKHKNHLSVSVTLDGNKELHDKCRLFPDGSGSYDLALDACVDWMNRGYGMGSKITIAPENVENVFSALKHMIDLGYNDIMANTVYEEGWNNSHALILYNQMKKVSDYMIEKEYVDDIYISLFEEDAFKPMRELDNKNWCFRAGTLISTPNGQIPIEDLHKNDYVYTKNGEIHPIEDLMVRESFDNYSIKASGMFNTFTTGDHPYLCKRFSHVGNKGKYKYHKPDWIKVKDIKKGDKIALFIHEFGSENIDPKIAYVVGRYIGDGWCSSTGYKICCNFDEYDEVSNALKEANIDYSFDRYPTVYQFNLFRSNTELINILEKCGHSAKEKTLPCDIYDWDVSSVEALLKGLFDADGNYKAGYKLQRINTISFILANQLLEVIRSLGYFPTCSIDERAGESLIEGRKVMIRDRYEISFKVDNTSRFMEYDEEHNVVWSTVRSVKELNESYNVFNLTVSDNHTFIANGALVHNCGGTGLMMAVDPDGYIYPCIRYMESSLGTDVKPFRIGDVENGMGCCKEYCDNVDCINCITRRSQSTDECFYCPIGQGCGWCSGYNYQLYGTPNKRATFICVMHKARALGSAYLFSRWFEKHYPDKKYEMYIPKSMALEIISEEEYEFLVSSPNILLKEKEVSKNEVNI